MKHIKNFRLFEQADNRLALLNAFRSELVSNGFDSPDDLMRSSEIMVSVGGKNVGELRISTYDGWASLEMVEVYLNFQRKGYGYLLYKSLLDSALKSGYNGLRSPAFDENFSGQQRSPEATALLKKLVAAEGGRIVDVESQVDQEFIEELKDEGAPFYGPPYLDFFVDGSGSVKNEKTK